jgi:hypothetical protein
VRYDEKPKLPPVPIGWKIWFAVVGLVTAGFAALAVWLVYEGVMYLRRH